MNIHYLTHVHYEGLGCIENWIKSNRHIISETPIYEKPIFPDINSFDWLIVMGGPMSVYEEDKYPWLKSEKEFISKAIRSNKVVIGICFGSQLIAEVLGAKVYAAKQKEIGWFPIHINKYLQNDNTFGFIPETINVFHWHGDTYDLPEGSTSIAESKATKNQAFVYNEKIIGLQFHFEITPDALNGMIENGLSELIPSEYVQSAEIIRNNNSFYTDNNAIMFELLNRLEMRFHIDAGIAL